MRKKLLMITVALSVFIGIGAAVYWKSFGNQEPGKPGQPASISNGPKENYQASTILKLKYGKREGEIGFLKGGEDFQAVGPPSFAVTDDKIYILDRVNERVQIFDQASHLEQIIPVGWGTDIVVDSSHTIYVLDQSKSILVEYQPGAPAPDKHPVPDTVRTLKLDEKGNISLHTINHEDYIFDKLGKTAIPHNTTESYSLIRTDEHSGVIHRNQWGPEITISVNGYLGFDVLGQDHLGNIFVVVTEDFPDNHIDLEVRKYGPDGQLLALVPIDVNYTAPPIRDLALDDYGNIYHLRPLNDYLLVEKWQQRQ